MEDGIYKTQTATYFVKDDKILMKLNGKAGIYKTNSNFFQGATFVEPLMKGMIESYDEQYAVAKSW